MTPSDNVGENFDFYCFLIWPFIEATWLGAVSLMGLTPPLNGPSDIWVNLNKAQDSAQLVRITLSSYFPSPRLTSAAWQNPLPSRWPFILRSREQGVIEECLPKIRRRRNYSSWAKQGPTKNSCHDETCRRVDTTTRSENGEIIWSWPTMGFHGEDCSIEARGVSTSIQFYHSSLSEVDINVVQQKPSRRSYCLFPCTLYDRHCRSTTIPKRSPIRRDRGQRVDTHSPKNRFGRESEPVKQFNEEWEEVVMCKIFDCWFLCFLAKNLHIWMAIITANTLSLLVMYVLFWHLYCSLNLKLV